MYNHRCGKSGTKNLVLVAAGNTAEETYLLAHGKAGNAKDCVTRAVGPLRSSADMQVVFMVMRVFL